MSNRLNTTPNDLSAFWMPFTANRQFKKEPRLFVGAKDMYYTTHDGRTVLDGTAGLWCVNAGHCRPKITEAIREQAGETRLRAGLPARPSESLRARKSAGRYRARGHEPRSLHQLRVGVGRYRLEGRSRLPPRQGQWLALPAHRPRTRLSRRQLRRHLGRRHRRQPQDVRHAVDGRRPPSTHAPADQERL
jgi:hypothetical protein